MNIIRSSRSDNVDVNLLHAKTNISTLNTKVQNSSIITATVYEMRPTGEAILSTAQGLVRSNTTLHLEKGDRVTARLAKDDSGNIQATIISKYDNLEQKNNIDELGIELLHKYITQGNQATNIESSEVLTARISYVVNNRNILKYGNFHPSDEISIQLLSPRGSKNNIDALPGEILNNSHDIVILQSPLGIININAKSNLSAGDKVLFRILNVPNQDQQEQVKTSISELLSAVASNLLILKQILYEMDYIDDDEHYMRLRQLISTHQNNSTLTKLFYNARNVPDNDVERWIDQEIVAAFEASSKSSDFEILGHHMSQITQYLVNLKVLPENGQWQAMQIPIPGYPEQKAVLKVRYERKNNIEFMVDIDHVDYGHMVLRGVLTLSNGDTMLPNLELSLHYENTIPEKLQNIIAQSFVSHKSLSAIDGNISFECIK
jgi:hypothetical protein